MIGKLVSMILVSSFVIASTPCVAGADESLTPPAPSVNMRAAIDRAVAQSSYELRSGSVVLPAVQAAARARQAPVAGGGGHKGAIIWSLVGTAASLGTTYYVVKEMRKQTDKMTQIQQ